MMLRPKLHDHYIARAVILTVLGAWVSDRIVMMEDGALVANVTKEELAAAPEDARIRRFMAQADAH